MDTIRTRAAKALLIALLSLASSFLSFTVGEAGAQTQPVTITITKIKCIADCRNAGLEAAGQSAPDFYAKVWINGVFARTNRAPDDSDDIEPFWVLTANVPRADGPFIPVRIQVWDHDSTSGDDLADTSGIPGDKNFDISVNMDTGKWSGDSANACTKGDDDDVAILMCIDVSVQSSSGDADFDGLLDGWERHGLDMTFDGIPDIKLPEMGANPMRKDLFIELDSEAGQAPTRAGIQAMKRAFARAPLSNPDGSTGVSLWIDTGNVTDPTANEAAPAANCGDGFDNDGNGLADGADPGCVGGAGANRRYLDATTEGAIATCADGVDNDGDLQTDAADTGCLVGDNLKGGSVIPPVGACSLDGAFYAAKQANFNALRRWVFRYAISAARPGTCGGVSGGQGETGGNDFVDFNHDGGTLLHELGHNVGLRHGGNVKDNCNPNYVSGMNYDNQFGINRVGGGAILDFSPPRIALTGSTRGVAPLNPLVENTLNENIVLDATDAANRFVFSTGSGAVVQVNLNATPNWNNDADPPLEGLAIANVNNGSLPSCANTSTTETLNGFNDWPVVSLPFRQFGDSADSAINPGPDDEQTLQQLEDHYQALHRTDLSVTVIDTPDPVASGTPLTYTMTVTNHGPNPASSVELTLTLPSEVSVGAVPAGCSAGGPIVTCQLGELINRAVKVVTIVTNVPASLVFDRGGPVTIAGSVQVRNRTGQESASANNGASVSTRVVAVADLAMASFVVPNAPLKILVGESVVVGLRSTISSGGPSSPMHTALELSASGSPGTTITPTRLTTSQPRLTVGEVRTVEDYVIVMCQRAGSHTFTVDHAIRPLNAADTDPNMANDARGVALEVECTGAASGYLHSPHAPPKRPRY